MKTLHAFSFWANTRVRPYVLCLFILHSSFFTLCKAQNVAINATGNQAAPSAMLDVSSTTAGVLIPRMNTTQRNAISSPAIGLQVYNTDCGELNYWNGTCWLSSSTSIPIPGAISGSATVCAGATGATFSVQNVSGLNYTWSVPTFASITAGQGTNSITVTFGTTSGTLCVIASDACESSQPSCINVGVSTGPPTPGSIAGTTSVCTNSTAVTYSVSPVIGATSYTWSLPTGATGSSTTNSITVNFTGASAGSASLCVAANNSCGAGSSSCLTITINPLPSNAGTISGSSSVCVGQISVTYSVPSILNSNASGYTWVYGGSGATISGSSNAVTVNFSSSATSGNLTVLGTNSCGNGTISANYPITVNPLPVAAGTISGNATVCQGATGVTYSVGSITGASSYTWSYSGSGATITGSTNSVTISFSSSATAGNLTVSGTNSCGNGTASAAYAISVNPLPSGTGTVSGASTVCQNQSGVSYSVSGISGATSYTWGYTGSGATITGTTSSVTVSFSGSATSGNLTVSGTNSCGNGTQAIYAITISPPSLSTPGSISGNVAVCTGGIGSYFVAPVTGATSYTWTYTGSGATISSASNQIDISFSNSATSGNLSVTANNGCGASASSANFAITVNTTPNSAFTFNPSSPVVGSQITFTPTDGTNQLYFWTFPDHIYSSVANPPIYLWDTVGTANAILTVTKNGCNATTSTPITTPAHGTATYTVTGTGTTGSLQYFHVPLSGVTSLTITANGAQGGTPTSYTNYPGGLGASIKGTIAVTAGEILKILVGQTGTEGGNDGGGGGGSFVTDNSNNPLIIAGGGGGGSYSSPGAGIAGSSSNNGTAGASGGTGGSGGSGGTSAGYAGAGGGLTGNGGNGPSGGNTCNGGLAFVNGGTGGCTVSNAVGGYGGGGGTHGGGWGGGGGGGYSGGGASSSSQYGGGGGGSYNAGTSQTNTTGGAPSGNGTVTIVY